jgi:Xaa-Pro aminopeptidase
MPTLSSLAALVREAASAEYPLDGWLLYDFRRQNPLAVRLAQLPLDLMLSRRWFLYIPANGTPTLLHAALETGSWNRLLAGENVIRRAFRSHQELDLLLKETLAGAKTIAMEVSERGSVPAVSRVDAGTLARVQETGVTVVTSADLLQQTLVWSEDDLAAHQKAVTATIAAKDAAFALIDQRLHNGQSVGEVEVQMLICQHLSNAGLYYDHPPIVGFADHAADPHYAPDPTLEYTLKMGDCVLIDLWAQVPGRPYADITWVGYAGTPSQDYLAVWQAVAAGRDAALSKLKHYQGLEGWEIDQACRDVIASHGYGEAFSHRTGHNLGVEIHGAGVNLDNFETHDTRKLIAGLCVTVEPGVYLPEQRIGIRSEVDVYLRPDGATVTTPIQAEPLVLGG